LLIESYQAEPAAPHLCARAEAANYNEVSSRQEMFGCALIKKKTTASAAAGWRRPRRPFGPSGFFSEGPCQFAGRQHVSLHCLQKCMAVVTGGQPGIESSAKIWK
jgi:hypothetical protein